MSINAPAEETAFLPIGEDEWVGREIGRFQILTTLGRGSLGPVYKARDLKLGRCVAAKVVQIDDDAASARLVREAQTAAGLQHPCLLTVLEVAEQDGFLFIFSELMSRGTLADWLSGHGPAKPHQAAAVIIAAARGLAHAHRHNVTHRDVKPSNVYLGDAKTVKLGDFGLARTLQEAAGLTRTALTTARLQHAAPELCRGKPAGIASDIYSLGSVLHQLITGVAPCPGDNPAELINHKLRSRLPDVRTLRAEVSADLAGVIAKAVEPDPSLRYADADRFADELKLASPRSTGTQILPALTVRHHPDAVQTQIEPVVVPASLRSRSRSGGSATRTEEIRVVVPEDDPAPDGYEWVAEIGRGPHSLVRQARDLRAGGRLVAIKLLEGDIAVTAEDRARFRLEAEAAARLRHPNIVQVYEVGEHEGRPFFALELCAGGTLADRAAGRPLPPRQAAEIMAIVARALHSAHKRGLLHRNLCPANILLTAEGAPKVADFGMAAVQDVKSLVSGASRAIGRPGYMAPEQINDQSRVGPSADVWAAGAVLYELLTGRPPLVGDSPRNTLRAALVRDPVPPRQLVPEVPADLETICLKCLARSPSDRYATAGALSDDLRNFVERRPIAATRPGPMAEGLAWLRRTPPAIAAVSATVGALFALTAASMILHRRSQDAEGRAAAMTTVADSAAEQASEALAGWMPEGEAAAYDRSERWFRLAKTHLAAGGGKLDDARAARAVSALRKAGREWAAKVRSDPDFEPLRGRDEYRTLLAEWDSAAADGRGR